MIFEQKDGVWAAGHDWSIFQRQFPYMGAFLYLHERQEAYLDDNCYRILHLSRESDSGLVGRDRFTQVMQDITRNPVAQQNQIYCYTVNGEQIHLRLSFVERDDKSWLGFMQDITQFMSDCTVSVDTAEYDPLTRLYHRDAFLRHTLALMRESPSVGYLAILHIHGIDQMAMQFGYGQSDRCIIAISQALQPFRSQEVIIGVRNLKEFFVYLGGDAAENPGTLFSQIRSAVSGCVVTDDFGEVLDIDLRTALSLSIGYCARPTECNDMNSLINHASFALFEAMSERKDICAFNAAHYRKDKEQYQELQYFRRLVRENLFHYHFQPIVSAKTGEVFGFEALMRAGDMPLEALRILEIAEKNKCLYDIEHATLFNTVQLMSENQDVLSDKKLFINAIPSHLLTEPDFDLLYETYGEVMEHAVIEITEQTDLDSDTIDTMKARCATAGCEFAIDDYGAGYSNTSSLLLLMPEYVRIDRILLAGIDSDAKKQRLVTDIISFCHENAMTVIAEGVETRPELRTVIRLGVDLIQGFYISKPKPFFSRSIAKVVQNEIISFNLESHRQESKTYIARNEEELELVPLALDRCTDLLVKRDSLTLIGEADRALKLSVCIEDGLDCVLTLRDVNLRAAARQTIVLGENCSLTLVLEGENTLSHMGILVPESASLTIVGDGDLNISTDRANNFAIGNDYEHAYGAITLATGGRVNLFINGEQCIGIGGGSNQGGAMIRLLSGEIAVTATGIECVGVGNHDGNARIEINDCELSVNADAASAVAVGAFVGTAEIAVNARVDIRATGNKSVGIGVLEHGRGTITIQNADISAVMNGRFISCIGTIDGSINTTVDSADITFSCEGSEIAGIGDSRGTGEIVLKDAALDMTLLAASILDVGTKTGSVSIEGGRRNVRINP